jgi:enoyl-CoA hydratase
VGDLVRYELDGGIATVTMDDGKVNKLSPDMLAEINAALDRAESDGAVVVLGGRPGVFSAGFDLKVLMAGGRDAGRMLRDGFELAVRVLSFPQPVVIACTGHALAMGFFLVLSADFRLGASGPFRIGANEVAIGIVMPDFGIEVCRQRLTPSYFSRAVINAEMFSPEDAMAGGALDRVVPVEELAVAARDVATGLAQLDAKVHTATKVRTREPALGAITAAIESQLGPRRSV